MSEQKLHQRRGLSDCHDCPQTPQLYQMAWNSSPLPSSWDKIWFTTLSITLRIQNLAENDLSSIAD